MKSPLLYFDHAATTPTDPAVLEAMLPYFGGRFGNASSAHGAGREAIKAVDEAREAVAKAIGAEIHEIYFTSGGTESDNWAIEGIAEAYPDKKHLISSKIEHPAVLRSLERLEKRGYEITYLTPDASGRVDPLHAVKAMREDTLLVSLMLANNETGVIQPVREIFLEAKSRGILTHTDAVQAVGAIPVDVKVLGADLLSLSAHKFYGPKGVGALFVRKGIKIRGFLLGGEQERGLRGGTYNTPAIVGLGAAISLAASTIEERGKKLALLKEYFLTKLSERLPFVKRNGGEPALPATVNLLFYGVKNTDLLAALDREGIAASAGSACASGSVEPSHVLTAMGLSPSEVRSSLRFSFGKDNTTEEVDRAVDCLVEKVNRLRGDKDLFLPIEQGSIES